MKTVFGICVVLVTLTLCIALLLDRSRIEAGRAAQSALDAVKSVLHITPSVCIASYITNQKTSDILELATVNKDFLQDYSFEHTFLGSTKKLLLRGDYSVKAGFDLRDRFAIQVDQKTQTVFADFPSPKVLSVQLNKYVVLEDTDGWWNKLTPEDRENAVNAMDDAARKSAVDRALLRQARESVTARLLDYGAASHLKWEIAFRGFSTPAKAPSPLP